MWDAATETWDVLVRTKSPLLVLETRELLGCYGEKKNGVMSEKLLPHREVAYAAALAAAAATTGSASRGIKRGCFPCHRCGGWFTKKTRRFHQLAKPCPVKRS